MNSTRSIGVPDSEPLIDLIEARRLASSGEAHAIRVACGLSLKDIGDAIGRTPASVHRWENGTTVPYGTAARRYARLLADLREHLNDERLVGEPGASAEGPAVTGQEKSPGEPGLVNRLGRPG